MCDQLNRLSPTAAVSPSVVLDGHQASDAYCMHSLTFGVSERSSRISQIVRIFGKAGHTLEDFKPHFGPDLHQGGVAQLKAYRKGLCSKHPQLCCVIMIMTHRASPSLPITNH